VLLVLQPRDVANAARFEAEERGLVEELATYEGGDGPVPDATCQRDLCGCREVIGREDQDVGGVDCSIEQALPQACWGAAVCIRVKELSVAADFVRMSSIVSGHT
jgi:hypothetical protein